jgi:DNA polymerase-3 subunit gamma/tau
MRTLRNAIVLGRVAHAYLFGGPRGTGKTTTARLLAKAVNCLDPDPSRRPCNTCEHCLAINANAAPDIIEIDAASNRGIDDIRDLRERVRYAPAQLPFKVYIIDEAHQITGAAANAFLKTLEEPPAHAIFILATTDPEELLPTIVSRCQRFEFRRVGLGDVTRRLRAVADREGMAVADEALTVIARQATGSVRDALGILEQMALLAGARSGDGTAPVITAADVRAALGLSANERVEGIVAAIADHGAAAALHIIQESVDSGEDPRQLNRQLLSYMRGLLQERAGGASGADERARALAGRFSLAELAALARRFGEIDFTIKHSPLPQLPLEIAVVEAATRPSPSAMHQASASTGENVAPAESARPASLRDRVRNPSSVREAFGRPPSEPAKPQSATITPLRPQIAPPSAPAGGTPPNFDVEQIADLWPQVRSDVKALNRRIEALLSEVDPVAVSGNQITLAVPYPFHRDKLNSDEVRETVAGVLSRLLARDVSLVCVLRGEVSLPGAAADAASDSDGAQVDAASAADPAQADEETEAFVRAAINIFDGEEIAELALDQPTPPADPR